MCLIVSSKRKEKSLGFLPQNGTGSTILYPFDSTAGVGLSAIFSRHSIVRCISRREGGEPEGAGLGAGGTGVRVERGGLLLYLLLLHSYTHIQYTGESEGEGG